MLLLYIYHIMYKKWISLLSWLEMDLGLGLGPLVLGLEDNVGELFSDPMEHAISSIVAFNPFW